MVTIRTASVALAISASLAAAAPSRAATGVPPIGIGQHAAVMNNFQQARRRHNAVISRVQNDIRSTRPSRY